MRAVTGPGPSEFAQPSRPADLGPSLRILLQGDRLNRSSMEEAFEILIGGRVHDAEIGAFLALLSSRMISAGELVGAATVLRRHVVRIPTPIDPSQILDTAGTGGAPKTFNVSTLAAIIAAAVGVKVAKHGNRSRTGRGSAEVLQSIGVNVDADPGTQARCLDEAGICFCFSVNHHPAARRVVGARKALSFPTVFNLLGPLTNPALAGRQIMGVYDAQFLPNVAEAMAALGVCRGIVLHSDDGLDEISIHAPTTLIHVERGRTREERFDPRTLGIESNAAHPLETRSLEEATSAFRDLIEGHERGPRREMMLVNAAAALVAGGVADSMETGFVKAAHAVDFGDAQSTLERLIEVSRGG